MDFNILMFFEVHF